MKAWTIVKLVLEVCGAACITYGAYSLAHIAGWVSAGVFALVWSYQIGELLKKERKQ